ncbi:hypothetical protein JXB37_07395, partial [candidate division WOR-3 bacterium]|nr:hypothetical protein [candidate division WOR-3 bacterium]
WPRGNHAVSCSTRLAGDTDNSNDRQGGSVAVRVPDVGVSHLLAPSGALDSGDVVTPACSAYNHGTTSESYSIRMRIGAGYSQAAVVNNHLPGTRRYVTFANWTAGAPGTYPVRCSTELVLDLVRANDRLMDTVTVGSYDVGCYRVAAPTGTVDSGATVTPAGWVRNHGTQPVANLPVVFRIGSVYADTQQVTSLPPGDSAQVTFANWTAVPGNWTAACTTRLAGDRNPGNDRATSSFFVQHRDVAVLSVSAPSQADSGTAVVTVVTVANRGNTTENVDFRLTISGTGYSQAVSRVLAPGPGTDTLTFPAWTAGPRGNRVLACTTLLAGDMNPANNRALDTTFVRVLDVAATRVVAPTGTVDSVASLTCQARVRNRGNTTVSFPLSFLVMGGDTTTLNGNANNLAPGESTVVTVGNWTVGPPGSYRTRVTTGLAGDMVPGNNIVADSFLVRSHDVAAVAILEPPAVVDSGASVSVRAVVANNGGGPENAIVFVTISGTGYRDSTFASLAPGGQDTVTLDNWSVVAQRGPHTVICSTWVAGDGNPANDTAGRAVSVRVRDVGTVQILAPSGAVDSGVVVTPWARIRNHGTDPETFPVRYTISDGYYSTRTLALGPGLDTVLTFDQWTANTIGVFETRCTTMLGTDIRHGNDFVSGTVRVTGNDAGITEVIAPVGGIEPGPVNPACRVQNFGAQTRDLVAWARITDAADSMVYFDSVALAGLAPDSSAVLEFGEWTVPDGGYTVRCSSWTANDHNPANDTLSASFFTLVHDVGMTAIISPLGRMDPVTVSPVARVANNGSATESFWCHFRIEDSVAGTVVYRDSIFTVDLGPGATRVERFAAWTAHVGRFRHTGWTRLDGDADPANDTARASVVVTPGAAGWEIRNDLPGGPEMRVVKHGGCLVGVETDRPAVYALKGNKCGEFYAYDVLSGTWQQLPGIPDGPIRRQVRGGADLCYDGAGHIYALKGNNTLEFWRYDLSDSSWNALPDVPAGARKLKYGSALAHISRDDSSWIYCLKGSKTFEFYAFSVEANAWQTMPSAPAGTSGKPYKSGSVMRTDGDGNLYVLKGRYNEFFKADARTCEWVMHPPMPGYGASGKRNKAKDGADLAWDGRGTLYGFGGGNRPFFFAFVDSANRWVELESLPHGPSGRRVKHGGSVAVISKRVWALKGNKTLEFWSYTPDTFLLFGARPDRSGAAEEPARVPRWSGDFLVGPSPAREELVVRAAPGAGRAMVELVSPAGRVVRSAALSPGGQIRFGLRDIAAGTWFVRIRTADIAETRKVIISP